MDKNIKDYIEKELHYYLIGNMLLIFMATGLLGTIIDPNAESTPLSVFNSVFSSAFFSAIVYIYVFILDSLVPSYFKDKILWIVKGKPGETIFTDIKNKNNDNRFMKEDVLDKYADIFQILGSEQDDQARRKLQNAYWYKIYKSHENEAFVYVSQRDFLLSRDMCIITLWIIIGYMIVKLIIGCAFNCGVILFFISEMIITWIIARNKAKRFAYNVIAADVVKRIDSADR